MQARLCAAWAAGTLRLCWREPPRPAGCLVSALQGYEVNPCHSKLHPAVTEAGIEPDEDEELPVQEAYTPESMCFGCGAAGQGRAGQGAAGRWAGCLAQLAAPRRWGQGGSRT